MKHILLKITKVLLTLFLIFFSCVLLICAGVWGYNKYKHYQQGKMLAQLPIDSTISFENMLAHYKETKINGNEMTVQEKLDLDLNPYVVDTSGNGISDYDAIHTYKTDPKKFSTADDGISDYAKIKEGLDPTKPINAKDIEPFTITDKKLELTLHTNDLNAKYHSTIEAFEHKWLDESFQPVRKPVRLKNYTGEVELSIPKNVKDKEKLTAYYFNFDKEKFEKIKKQRMTDHSLFVTVDQSYPIYLLHPESLEELSTYYYFRVSTLFLSEALGFDHKIFVFKRGLFTDEFFVDEVVEDVDYGIIEFSYANVSYAYTLFLEALFNTLDLLFQPLDDVEGNLLAHALIGYGKTEGTPEYVKRFAFPWLYEHEELETENEWSSKVIDSGFRLKQHAFRFGNLQTKIGDNGICAGFSRATELIYNGEGIELAYDFDPETWQNKLIHFIDGQKFSSIHYDLTPHLEHYPFLEDGLLFHYRFTDKKIAHLSEEKFVDGDLWIEPSEISEPDQSIIKMLETQWMYSNELKFMNEPKYPNALSVLDQVEKLLSEGQIIYASLGNRNGGHTVSIYKMEYDKYDPDLIRFYVYDSNLPYPILKEMGKQEVYMEVYKTKQNTMYGSGEIEYFDFDYTPFESHRDSYSYSSMNGEYVMQLYHNDTPLHGEKID